MKMIVVASTQNTQPIPKAPKKVYTKPVLTILGDVRSITLGGSPGLGESSGLGGRSPKIKTNEPIAFE